MVSNFKCVEELSMKAKTNITQLIFCQICMTIFVVEKATSHCKNERHEAVNKGKGLPTVIVRIRIQKNEKFQKQHFGFDTSKFSCGPDLAYIYRSMVLLIDIIIWTRCQNKRKGFINDKENQEFKWEEFCYRIHFKVSFTLFTDEDRCMSKTL